MGKEQKIFDKAAECRIFLRVHGFITDLENDKIWIRIDKYGDANRVIKVKKEKKS